MIRNPMAAQPFPDAPQAGDPGLPVMPVPMPMDPGMPMLNGAAAPALDAPMAAPVYTPGMAADGHMPLPKVSQDFWDISDPEFTGRKMVEGAEFSQLVTVDSARRQRPLAIAVLVTLLALVAYVGYESLVLGEDPVARLMALLEDLGIPGLGSEAGNEATAIAESTVHEDAAPTNHAPVAARSRGRRVAGNPYWHLPNRIVGMGMAPGPQLTAEDEEVLRAGLAHKFTFQRYKTVKDIRAHRGRGSEAILWEAMQDKKFWTRMFAAVGLAEMNTEVSLQSLEGALAGARSELVANFFERFTKKPNAGQRFILRQVVRLLDERGRFVALRGIAAGKDELRDLYLTAATRDPGKRVQKWVKTYLANNPIDPDRYNQLLTVIDGTADARTVLPGLKAGKPVKAPNTGMVATEEEMEKELAAFEEGGVTFYDDKNKSGPTDEADADTFDVVE